MKQLIVICGFSGSGKTTLGRALAKKLGYAFVDKDTVCEQFTNYILSKNGQAKHNRESFLYKTEINRLEYITCLQVCKDIIDNGVNVVAALPLASQIENYEKWKLLSVISGLSIDTEVKFVWIKHNAEREKQNLSDRQSVKDVYKLSNWDEYIASIDGLKIDDDYKCIEIDNNQTVDQMIDQIIENLNP